MDEGNIVVCIPYYKSSENLTAFERDILVNNIEKLSSYTIYFMVPDRYKRDAEAAALNYMRIVENTDIRLIVTADRHLMSVKSYDKFLKTPAFYAQFSTAEYVCICQLDAWIFRDVLRVTAGYDYPIIGAPWILYGNKSTRKYIGAGNGGYTLRNIEVAKRALSASNSKINSVRFNAMIEYIIIERTARQCKNLKDVILQHALKVIANRRVLHRFHIARILLQEDMFLSLLIYSSDLSEKMPSVQEAALFSYEINPEYLYSLTGFKLPSGCHAPVRYGLGFWSNYILSINKC